MIRPLSIFLVIWLVVFNVVLVSKETAKYLIPVLVIGTFIAAVCGFSKTVLLLAKIWKGEMRIPSTKGDMDIFEKVFYLLYAITLVTLTIKLMG